MSKQQDPINQSINANDAYSKTFRLLKLSDMIKIAKTYRFIEEATFVVQNHESGYLTLTLMPEFAKTIVIINVISKDSEVTIKEVDTLIEQLPNKS